MMERRPRAAITHRFQCTLIAELEIQLQNWCLSLSCNWCLSQMSPRAAITHRFQCTAVDPRSGVTCRTLVCTPTNESNQSIFILSLDLKVFSPVCFPCLLDIGAPNIRILSCEGGSSTTTNHHYGTNIGPVSKELPLLKSYDACFIGSGRVQLALFKPSDYIFKLQSLVSVHDIDSI